jgi:hypothetical protein
MKRSTAYSNNIRRKHASAVSTRDKVILTGGLNLVQSASKIKPGELLVVKNYEPYFVDGAYKRTHGFERFDGQPQPHKAEYWKIAFTGINNGPFTVGNTVTASSGETATISRYVLTDAEGNGYIIVTDLSDSALTGVTWTEGSTTALATSGTDYEGELDEDQHDISLLSAETIRRNLIGKVGGAACAGNVLGVNIYNGNIYAFRNNASGTAATLWKNTSSGWAQIDLGYLIRFNTGTTEINEGDTVTGSSSGASCTVRRVVVTDGFWSGDDAEGYFVTDLVTGGPFTNGENLQVSASTVAVGHASNVQTTQSIQPGGDYNFRNHNFGGHTSTYRMYGTNKVGTAFEFDGTYYVPIETGMVTDKPINIAVHRGHLLLAYTGGSLQMSGKNAPLSFTPITGANELLTGDEITGFVEETRDVTFVFTRNQTYRLEGFVQENIQLKLHNFETGAIADTVQRIGRSLYLDDRGYSQLAQTDTFGDFASAQISLKIDPLIQGFISNTAISVQKSIVHRGKSLYRCFFSSNEAIVIGFSGNKVNGITIIDYGKDITTMVNSEINGEERIFFGSTDGYVYESDVGRNFDGADIEAYCVTAYHFAGNPEVNKRWRDMVLYMEGDGRATIKVSADYNYNETPQNFETIMNQSVFLGGGRYGISRHGDFIYSAASKSDVRVSMNSHSRNVSMIMYHKEAAELPHILYDMNFHISRRKMIRR